MYKEAIRWILPNLFLFDNYSFALSDLLMQCGMINPLKQVYGTVRCKWSFNVDSFIKAEDREYIEQVFEMYNSNGIIPILNFSKISITEDDLKDDYCNFLMQVCADNKGGFIVASDILFNYIKSHYPQNFIIASVNKPIYKFQSIQGNYNADEEFEYYNLLAKTYDMVCIRPEFVSFIEQGLYHLYPQKFILTANSACTSFCQDYDKCFNQQSTDFICHKELLKREGKISESLQNLPMLSDSQIESLFNMGFSTFMLRDNKHPLCYLYNLFNSCLFSEKSYFREIDSELKTRIKKLGIITPKSIANEDFFINISRKGVGEDDY